MCLILCLVHKVDENNIALSLMSNKTLTELTNAYKI